MKHLGDITLIRGDEIEPVNCIIGGSPCQDLSVAGKRAGLSGARSGLFMEQIRIVKEMRRKYGKPRYMVWENVPGAFSSNRGEDFRIVLEEIVKVVDESATVPQPPKGRWAHAGCVVGDGYSVAWRVHDAQFWGVPQRRRRIALVADFGGETAPEILFERDGVSGDSETRGEAREGAAGSVEGGVKKDGAGCLTPWDCQSRRIYQSAGVFPTLSARRNSGANNQAVICLQGNVIDRADTVGCNGRGWRENVSYTLNTIDRPAVCYDMAHASDVIRDCGEVSPTLQGRMGTGGNQIPLTFSNQGFGGMAESDVASTQCSNQCKLSSLDLSVQDGAVRRLTPLECERLQGFPDGWTDIGNWIDTKGKKHKSADAPRYKALGNSIALPFWLWMLRRMSEYLPAGATMGSLFDGIGGFPLCWETFHGRGSARWASEIEEFPIAVTKLRFPEEEE